MLIKPIYQSFSFMVHALNVLAKIFSLPNVITILLEENIGEKFCNTEINDLTS